MHWSRKSGFTLVELLVVIAIIGILIALLLPAVQAAREAARRSACSNNLKQMGIAIHNYADVQKVLPPGNISYGGCCGNKFQVNWAIGILPYMEQSPVYALYNPRYFIEDPENQALRESPIPTYCCPSDGEAGKLGVVQNGGVSNGQTYRRGSYKAMSGYCSVSPEQFWSSAQVGNLGLNTRGPLHIVGYDRKYKCEPLTLILDGTANTLLVGEYYSSTHISRGVFWALPYGGHTTACAFLDARPLVPDYDYCIVLGPDNLCKHTFAPAHPGGIQFCLCDGSVRLVSTTIDLNLWVALATIAGSEPGQVP